MRQIILFSNLIFLIACNQQSHGRNTKFLAKKKIDIENGIKTEYYENSKLIKIQGQVNDDTLWNGRVNAYAKNGSLISSSNYQNGRKNGVHQVFFNNGSLKYTGEFKNDTMIGKWLFYNEKGVFEKEKIYN